MMGARELPLASLHTDRFFPSSHLFFLFAPLPTTPPLTHQTYKVGDIVDIKANSAQQKGMPHKYYQGRTGVIYNVSKSAVGIIVYKVVGNRYIEKRVNIKVEHVQHSKCRDDFLRRVKENAAKKREAKENGTQVNVKRLPAQPREARTIAVSNDNAVETLAPMAYDTVSGRHESDGEAAGKAYAAPGGASLEFCVGSTASSLFHTSLTQSPPQSSPPLQRTSQYI